MTKCTVVDTTTLRKPFHGLSCLQIFELN